MLIAKDISKQYGSNLVLNKVQLVAKQEQIRAFLGPNGAGKTTTFNIIAGVERSNGGEIHLDGEKITNLPIHVRARNGLAYLPQETSLFRGLLVKENVKVYLNRTASQKSKKEQVARTLQKLNILAVKDRRVGTLSAGQKRKVELARALVLSPDYFLLDEPFSELDPQSVKELQEVLTSLKRAESIGIVLSDHRAQEAISIADYNYLIHKGRIIAEGTTNDILESEVARKTYLGDGFRTATRPSDQTS